MNTPCSADPWLWVYAFWHEVPFIFAMLFLPDPVDYVQERFGKPHHRKRRYKGKVQILQPADINPGKGLGWAAWKMTEWVDRVGWYLLIADTSVQFAINWTSLVYQWSGCQTPGQPYIAKYFKGGIEYSDNGWNQIGLLIAGSHIFRDGGASTIVVPADYEASFAMSITVTPRPWPYNNPNIELRLLNNNTGQIHELPPLKVNSEGKSVVSQYYRDPGRVNYDRVYTLQARVTGEGFAWVTDAIFSAYGSKKIEGLIPWLGDKAL